MIIPHVAKCHLLELTCSMLHVEITLMIMYQWTAGTGHAPYVSGHYWVKFVTTSKIRCLETTPELGNYSKTWSWQAWEQIIVTVTIAILRRFWTDSRLNARPDSEGSELTDFCRIVCQNCHCSQLRLGFWCDRICYSRLHKPCHINFRKQSKFPFLTTLRCRFGGTKGR